VDLGVQELHGGELIVRESPADAGKLLATIQTGGVAVSVELERGQVQRVTQALDDWLYDSRPA